MGLSNSSSCCCSNCCRCSSCSSSLNDVVSANHQWKEGLLSSMTEAVRWSYGAGLVLRLGGIARLELNYVIPVRVQPNDRSVCQYVCLSLFVSLCLRLSFSFFFSHAFSMSMCVFFTVFYTTALHLRQFLEY